MAVVRGSTIRSSRKVMSMTGAQHERSDVVHLQDSLDVDLTSSTEHDVTFAFRVPDACKTGSFITSVEILVQKADLATVIQATDVDFEEFYIKKKPFAGKTIGAKYSVLMAAVTELAVVSKTAIDESISASGAGATLHDLFVFNEDDSTLTWANNTFDAGDWIEVGCMLDNDEAAANALKLTVCVTMQRKKF